MMKNILRILLGLAFPSLALSCQHEELFIDTGNLFVWFGDMKTVSVQEQQKEYYRNAIRETEEKLDELEANKDSLEKFAREQYLFHEPDEEVFIITE